MLLMRNIILAGYFQTIMIIILIMYNSCKLLQSCFIDQNQVGDLGLVVGCRPSLGGQCVQAFLLRQTPRQSLPVPRITSSRIQMQRGIFAIGWVGKG